MYAFNRILSVVFIGTAVALVGCGGGGGGLADPGLSNVKVETGSARSALITSDGGTITTTGSNGVVYTLTIPPGAFGFPTRVGMYPITTLANFPSGAAILAGVHFTPEGTLLQIPATLTARLPASLDASKLVGAAYTANGQDERLYPALAQGQTVTMSITHFSGYVLASQPAFNLLQNIPVTDPGFRFQSQIMGAFLTARQTNSDPRPKYLQILQDWYAQVVKPALDTGGAASSTPEENSAAAREVIAWKNAIAFARQSSNDSSFAVEPQFTQSKGLFAEVLRRFYKIHNDACIRDAANSVTDPSPDSNPLLQAAIAAMVTPVAQNYGIDVVSELLDQQTVLDSLCVQVVIKGQNFTGSKPGGTGGLSLNSGFSINEGPMRTDLPMNIKITGDGTAHPATGQTNGSGNFTTAVDWPNGVDPIKIGMLSSIDQYPLIARFDQITKGSSNIAGIQVNPPGATTAVGQPVTLNAVALNSSGNQVSVDPSLWAWTATSPATIAPHGASATVTMTSGGKATVVLALGGTGFTVTADVVTNFPPPDQSTVPDYANHSNYVGNVFGTCLGTSSSAVAVFRMPANGLPGPVHLQIITTFGGSIVFDRFINKFSDTSFTIFDETTGGDLAGAACTIDNSSGTIFISLTVPGTKQGATCFIKYDGRLL